MDLQMAYQDVLTPTLCGRLLPTFAGRAGGVKKGPASGLAPLGLAPQGGASWFRWAFSSAREAAPPSPPAPGNSGPPGPWSPVSCSPSRLTEVLQEIPWLGLALSAVSRPSWQPWRARGSSPASRRVSASRAPDIDAHSLWPPLAHLRWPCRRREEGAGLWAGPFGTGAARRGQLVQVGVQLSSGGSTSVTACSRQLWSTRSLVSRAAAIRQCHASRLICRARPWVNR